MIFLRFFKLFLLILISPILILPNFLNASTSTNTCALDAGTATYDFKVHGSSVGSVVRTESLDTNQPGHYKISSITQAKFLFFKDRLTENSVGLITNLAVTPGRYQITDTRSKKNLVITFDQDKKTAELQSSTLENLEKNLTIPDNIQDNLSYVLALRLNLIQKLFKPGQALMVLAQDKNKKIIPTAFYFSESNNSNSNKNIELTRVDSESQITYHYWFSPSENDLLIKTEAVKNNQAGQNNQDDIIAETDLQSYKKSDTCLVS